MVRVDKFDIEGTGSTGVSRCGIISSVIFDSEGFWVSAAIDVTEFLYHGE